MDENRNYRRRIEKKRRAKVRRLKISFGIVVLGMIVLMVVHNVKNHSSDNSDKEQSLNVMAVDNAVTAAPLSIRTHLEVPDNPDWISQEFISINHYSRPGTELEVVNGIVIHYVGNPGTRARANRDYYESLAVTGDTYASSHFVISTDGTIIQCVPLDEIAYCSNDRNSDTISIECCHPDDTGEFTEETYQSLVKLTNWLVEYYGLNRDEIIRHYDVTGKECPKYYVDNPDEWESFKDDITFN